jgi:hypothetical protein
MYMRPRSIVWRPKLDALELLKATLLRVSLNKGLMQEYYVRRK